MTGTGEQHWDADIVNADGQGPIVLACEHASAYIPDHFDNLGLEGDALTSHIAWDPGAAAVADILATMLDAPAIKAPVSRLVYDCNRPPEAESAAPAKSEIYTIPGNHGLTLQDRRDRAALYYYPFRQALTDILAARDSAALVTIHSFNPVYKGEQRKVEIGIIHDRDDRLALALKAALTDTSDMKIAINDPYGPEDGVTHTLIKHGVDDNRANVMIEIRNDLIADSDAQQSMASLLGNGLKAALASLSEANRSPR